MKILTEKHIEEIKKLKNLSTKDNPNAFIFGYKKAIEDALKILENALNAEHSMTIPEMTDKEIEKYFCIKDKIFWNGYVQGMRKYRNYIREQSKK